LLGSLSGWWSTFPACSFEYHIKCFFYVWLELLWINEVFFYKQRNPKLPHIACYSCHKALHLHQNKPCHNRNDVTNWKRKETKQIASFHNVCVYPLKMSELFLILRVSMQLQLRLDVFFGVVWSMFCVNHIFKNVF